MKNFFTKITLILLVLAFSNIINAQNQANRWYFSTTDFGFNFDPTTHTLTTTNEHVILPYEGIGVANDPTSGDLLFYTDGIKVYNKNHALMANGSSLSGGTSSTQSGMICQVPGSLTKYYIFSSSGNAYNGTFTNGALYYSIVDMNLNSGTGDVIASSKNTFIGSNVCEALEIVPSSIQNIYWLIAPNNNSNTITVYKVDSAGVNLLNTYTTGYNLKSAVSARYSKVLGKIAVGSINDADPILIFDINPATGQLSNTMTVVGTPFYSTAHSMSDYAGVLDLEWSGNGSKLYISTLRGGNTSGGQLYQYDLNNTNLSLIYSASSSNTSIVGKGLKRGPDNKIYYLYTNANSTTHDIGVINSPDSSVINCDFNATGIYSMQDLGSTTKFCEFLPEQAGYAIDSCAIDPLSILIQGSSGSISSCTGHISTSISGGIAPYNYFWNNLYQTPNLINLCPGEYSVNVTDATGCSTTASYTIHADSNIAALPLVMFVNVHDVNSPNNCNGKAQVSAYGGLPPYVFSFNNGQTGPITNGLCAGVYSAYVTDANGNMDSITFVVSSPTNTFVDSINIRPDSVAIATVINNAIQHCSFTYANVDSVIISHYTFVTTGDSIVVYWVIYDDGNITNIPVTYPVGPNGVYTVHLNLYCPSRSAGASLKGISQVYVNSAMVGSAQLNSNKPIVYPTLFNQDLTIYLKDGLLYNITLCDISGKRVAAKELQGEGIHVIDFRDLPVGYYSLTLDSEKGKENHKLIKQ